jgi:hypothetical protein
MASTMKPNLLKVYLPVLATFLVINGVLLNLYNTVFYAVRSTKLSKNDQYEPAVFVSPEEWVIK